MQKFDPEYKLFAFWCTNTISVPVWQTLNSTTFSLKCTVLKKYILLRCKDQKNTKQRAVMLMGQIQGNLLWLHYKTTHQDDKVWSLSESNISPVVWRDLTWTEINAEWLFRFVCERVQNILHGTQTQWGGYVLKYVGKYGLLHSTLHDLKFRKNSDSNSELRLWIWHILRHVSSVLYVANLYKLNHLISNHPCILYILDFAKHDQSLMVYQYA